MKFRNRTIETNATAVRANWLNEQDTGCLTTPKEVAQIGPKNDRLYSWKAVFCADWINENVGGNPVDARTKVLHDGFYDRGSFGD